MNNSWLYRETTHSHVLRKEEDIQNYEVCEATVNSQEEKIQMIIERGFKLWITVHLGLIPGHNKHFTLKQEETLALHCIKYLFLCLLVIFTLPHSLVPVIYNERKLGIILCERHAKFIIFVCIIMVTLSFGYGFSSLICFSLSINFF